MDTSRAAGVGWKLDNRYKNLLGPSQLFPFFLPLASSSSSRYPHLSNHIYTHQVCCDCPCISRNNGNTCPSIIPSFLPQYSQMSASCPATAAAEAAATPHLLPSLPPCPASSHHQSLPPALLPSCVQHSCLRLLPPRGRRDSELSWMLVVLGGEGFTRNPLTPGSVYRRSFHFRTLPRPIVLPRRYGTEGTGPKRKEAGGGRVWDKSQTSLSLS